MQHFKQALEFKPEIEHRILYKKIGTLSFRRKEYDISVRAFETAITFIQTDPELFYLQALVYVAQWKFEDALASINKALYLNSAFKEAEKAKEKILAWAKANQDKETQPVPTT